MLTYDVCTRATQSLASVFFGFLHDHRAFSVSTNDKEHIFSTFVCFVCVLPLFLFNSSSSCVVSTNQTDEEKDEREKKIKAIYFKHSEIVRWWAFKFCFLSISFNVCIRMCIDHHIEFKSIGHFLFYFVFDNTQHPNMKNQFFCYSSLSPIVSLSLARTRSIFTYVEAMHFQRLYS